MGPTSTVNRETGQSQAALGLYFLQADGACFKCVRTYEPYFLLLVKEKYMGEVEEFLRRTFGKEISSISSVEKEDLDLVNHLSGLKRKYMKVGFQTIQALLSVRGKLMGKIKKNRRRLGIEETYSDMHQNDAFERDEGRQKDYADFIYDIREYDVTYYQRVAIDLGFRVGLWYEVRFEGGAVTMECKKEIMARAALKVFAFDIETTHAPMRFPDNEVDNITMISYMLDQQGYLIVNRELVSEDIRDFEYSPKPEFYGPFRIFNVANEAAVLRRFFDHIKQEKPHVYVSFNGDGFDWPFIEARAKINGLSMQQEIGMHGDRNDEYTCHYASHLDCYKWVVRDSYLPAGSQGLKAVTKAKLGYDPLELDPEEMVRFATEKPQTLASYSVSDAVATYYLYKNYVDPFIFSLCTIIPMHPDDVLRKGSGTLCEALLMVQATLANVVYPNKMTQDTSKMHNGHLVESETYIGGHVESLAAGLFRSDIAMQFDLDVPMLEKLLEDLDSTLKFAVETDGKGKMEDVTNYDEVRDAIATGLQALIDDNVRQDMPMIYHLDVGAMYPNIILTNRLQPSAIVDELTCAGCDFNKPENQCQRKQNWTWRGELFPSTRAEYEQIRTQIESEKFPSPYNPNKTVTYFQLPAATQELKLKQRLRDYCRRVYKKNHTTVIEERQDTVCMRENSFYVDTVRLFRDRRYVYKAEWGKWKGNLARALKEGNAEEILKAREMSIVYESLQIAHKCILNSFYGYVMRRGARWFSMRMAGMVTKTGAQIIQRTRELVERVGIALELDTDGIWCVLPQSMPENFKIQWKDEKRRPFQFSYMCEVLNHMVNREFTNDQYQDLVDPVSKRYEIKSENSIFFEVDGPYRAMVMPASAEEGKTLKKRYAVYNHDGTLAELKGFELKRRGELNLIKIFQGKVFQTFLNGDTLAEAYASVAEEANKWLDILFNKGRDVEDEELINLLSSSSNMSKALAEYGDSKSNAITTAKRLGEFLGPQMVANKGLSCKYLISKAPQSAPVTERAIPVIIFSNEIDANTRNFFLRKWTRDTSKTLKNYGIREILDWDYYIARFGKTLQKICTIPAAMQGVPNPIPRVPDPDWLRHRKAIEFDPKKQRRIDSLFTVLPPRPKPVVHDIESLASVLRTPNKAMRSSPSSSQKEPSDPLTPFSLSQKQELVSVTAKRRLVIEDEEEVAVAEVQAMATGKDVDDDDTDVVLRQDDYSGWLQQVKETWKEQRVERKKRQAMATASAVPKYLIRNYVDRGRFRYARAHWQIIQVVETNHPGEFDVWAVVGDEGMRKLRVIGDRHILVNSVLEDADQTGAFPWPAKKVAMLLPHSKPSLNLYELKLPELLFQRSFRELSAAFASADVEGVYETKTSLLFNTITKIGSCATVDVTRLAEDDSNVTGDFFRSEYLIRRSVGRDYPYVTPANLQVVYLYHSCSKDQSRGAFGLYLPEVSSEVLVVLYQNQRLDVTRVEELLRSKSPGRNFEVKKFTRRDLATKQIDKALSGQLALSYGRPAIVAIQTTVSDAQLFVEIPSLSDFPTLRLSANEQDNQYEAKASSWESFAMNCLVQRESHVATWMDRQVSFAAYAGLPLANFSSDFPNLVSDVFFARALRRNNLVSWASDHIRPDLGGLEEDNNIILVDLENPEIVVPGCYSTVCIELNLTNLAIDAILMSHLINVAEGGPALSSTTNKSHANPSDAAETRQAEFETFDDTSDCVPAFQVLRSLVQQWTVDLGSPDDPNEWAEMLLLNVYHWISSPQSKTYDPAIHRLIHMLMGKVFLQLLHELKNLGSKVVYATFNQVIIVTNKTNVEDAKAYWEFIHRTLFQNDLFSWLSVDATSFWQVLLFSDISNMGGVAETGAPGEAPQIVSNWNIAEYLPPPVDQSFILTISEYLMNLYTQQLSSSAAKEAESSPKKAKRAASLITSDLTQRLFHAVSVLDKNKALREAVNPKKLPGVEVFSGQSPALQFVTTVTHILALDKQNMIPVHNLRRDLLKLLGIDDFSPEAVFRDPAPSFILQDLICDFCAHPHNLDLLRDPQLLNHSWECAHCSHRYNKLQVEAMLVQKVYQLSYAYQAQDMVCQKCKLVKAENLSNICPTCSGTFVCRMTGADFQQRLSTMHKIADFHSMPWLGGVVAQLN